MMQSQTHGNQQCIIVMVERSYQCCCCDIKFDVPSNFTVLEESFGKSEGIMQAGAQWFYCCNRRVACMLTKNIVNYDAPIVRCPTKDNAYVDVDIHFTFRLPQVEEQVMAFVYKLGAGRFDELLAAEVEENMRNFINSIWLSQVFDLKSDMASSMMQELNTKFASYGIVFEQCNVTNVIVSPQLIGALQEKTRLKFELKNHIKEQENKKLTLENQEQQKLTDLQRNNERKMYELKQNITRARIDKEQEEIAANTKKDVAKVKAEEEASVLITRAEGQQRIVVNEVKADTVSIVNKAKAEAKKLIITTDKQIAVMGIDATTNLDKNKAKYQALVQECEAEKQNMNAINAQREHDYQVKKAESYKALSEGRNTTIVMSGQSGESLLDKIFNFDK